MTFRSGFACFVGRPNVGKSTLTNALVGEKVAITSSRPQTTRHTIRGMVNRAEAQLVLIDTPGLHRPRTLLGQRLNALVRETLAEVDVIGFCVPANEKVGAGDGFIARELAELRRTPQFAIVTKSDLVSRQELAEQLLRVSRLGDFAEVIPVSALAGDQVDLLADLLVGRLPEGPELYPGGELTDEPEAVMVAELIREAALEGVRDELPHSLAVVVDEMIPRVGRHPNGRCSMSGRSCTWSGPVRRRSSSAGAANACATWGPPLATRSNACSARRSISISTSRSPRTGSAIPSNCVASASERGIRSTGSSNCLNPAVRLPMIVVDEDSREAVVDRCPSRAQLAAALASGGLEALVRLRDAAQLIGRTRDDLARDGGLPSRWHWPESTAAPTAVRG